MKLFSYPIAGNLPHAFTDDYGSMKIATKNVEKYAKCMRSK